MSFDQTKLSVQDIRDGPKEQDNSWETDVYFEPENPTQVEKAMEIAEQKLGSDHKFLVDFKKAQELATEVMTFAQPL